MSKVEVGEIFTISGMDEEEHEAEVLAVLPLDGREYVAVSFVEDLENEDEEDLDVYFLRVDDEGDFEFIESDDEFEKVSDAFARLYE